MSAQEGLAEVYSIRDNAAELLQTTNEIDALVHRFRDDLQAKVFALDLATDEQFRQEVQDAESGTRLQFEDEDAFAQRLSQISK